MDNKEANKDQYCETDKQQEMTQRCSCWTKEEQHKLKKYTLCKNNYSILLKFINLIIMKIQTDVLQMNYFSLNSDVLLKPDLSCCSTEKPPRPASVSPQQPAVSGVGAPDHLCTSSGCPRLRHRRRHQAAAAHQPSQQHRQTEPAAHKHSGSISTLKTAGIFLYLSEN